MSELTRHTRQDREAAESRLSPAATRSINTRGRVTPEPLDPMRTPFERDRDRIIHTNAFRRLMAMSFMPETAISTP